MHARQLRIIQAMAFAFKGHMYSAVEEAGRCSGVIYHGCNRRSDKLWKKVEESPNADLMLRIGAKRMVGIMVWFFSQM